MAERQWTKAQKTAIELDGHTLLVSAAAGSGKTAVLTERIIRRMTDPEKPLDITRTAIVTFTRAAASELKERLSAALEAACAAEPRNKRLQNQLIKLSGAKIGTIHSFCFDMIRAHFSDLGLRSGLRIADDAEIRLHKKSAMEKVIDGYYDMGESCPITDFHGFVDLFVSDRDDKLADIFIELSNKLSSIPQGISLLTAQADSLTAEEGLPYKGWGEVIRSMVDEEMEYYGKIFSEAADCMDDGGKLAKNYLPSFTYDAEFIGTLRAALKKGGYDEIRKVISDYSPITLGRGVKAAEQTDEIQLFKKHRTDFSKRLKALASQYFAMTAEQLEDSKQRTAKALRDIHRLLSDYTDRLNSEKQRLGILDFADLEILAARLLYDENGELTKAAESVRAGYDEIYIDEYQDTNELQDSIFRAIAKPDGRFMVGDIKQSIYSFRGAKPQLFADYRREFTDYDDEHDIPEDSDGVTVYLSNNFRSDKGVIDFINVIFGCLFTYGSGNIPYTENDALIYSKTDRPEHPVRLALIEKPSDDESGDADDSDSMGEAEYVASEISKLLDEGVSPKDIAILFRSAKKSAKPFEKALEKLGVPYYNDVTKSFFDNPEIQLAMCLLNCIDNPTRDISLAGALRSPLFGFTLDELARIRLESKDGPLFDALQIYTESNDFEKGRVFLESLERWRTYSISQPVDKLIWYLWQETGMLGIGKGVAKKNLMLLYEHARRFEAGSFRGLYNFILYINDILSERATLENAKEFSESDDTVHMTTIHGSKGLEYRVCFVCGCNSSFNKNDLREPILFEASMGASVKLRDETGFARFTTPMRQAFSLKLNENSLEEEMRVLYVALTRAKERLYVTAEVNDARAMLDEAENSALFMSKYSLNRKASYMKWMLTALRHDPSYGGCTVEVYGADDITAPKSRIMISDKQILRCGNELSEDEYRKVIDERFSYEYPWRHLTGLPAKLTVSKLHPRVLDESDTSAELDEPTAKTEMRTPRFLEGETKPTGAERGTATHTFMQFCDFANVDKYGIKEELERLVAEEYITRASADMVNTWMLERFFESRLYRDIRSAERVWREVRFNIRYPASDFTDDMSAKAALADETILVQGVVDCFYIDKNGDLILVDYKTDYIPQELREIPGAPEQLLIDRHKRQLGYYRTAIEELTGRKVARTVLYAFSIPKVIVIE